MTVTQRKYLAAAIPVVLALLVIGLLVLVRNRDTQRLLNRKEDQAPTIEFTWTPAGEVSLKEMQGMLTIRDDYALDFTTYRMKLVEAERELDLPIPGMMGKDYEQSVSFSLIADDPKLVDQTKLTVIISISDDAGHSTELTKVIPLKKGPAIIQLNATPDAP
jgi:hypothetical protein